MRFLSPLLVLLLANSVYGQQPPSAPRPNVIVILSDDQGYADLGCFGAEGFETPNLDRMAREGIRFQEFHVASSVCSPSRAALMTGCYPQRVGLPAVLEADSETGLNADEETLPELLKQAGYATAMFGKWHLGDRPQFLPTRHGFDEYFGLPYSNDQWPFHPTKKIFFPDLPVMEGERIVGHNPDQSQLTRWYTERSINFIERNKDRPFFLYVAHNMPHVPLAASEQFRGKSKRGLYGDACMELDWSVGEIQATLKRLGIDDRTLVIYFSDNGPWLSYGSQGGSARPLREGKTTSYEGGFRVPCIMRWPGHVAAGHNCLELVTAMDILPTVVRQAGATPPRKKIDGHDISAILSGEPGAKSPYDVFYYYNAWALEAVRSGRWKLMLPATRWAVLVPGRDGMPGQHHWVNSSLALYDLVNDPGEESDMALERPDVVEQLLARVAEGRDDLGDGVIRVNPEKKDFFQARRLFRIPGHNTRPPGR
ncbi:MAG TPA: sulfatase [Pirellulales bacterium]|jgi:arylsulfatase A-like enzyme|nr:sulfatase [Pirellulales bacterium]